MLKNKEIDGVDCSEYENFVMQIRKQEPCLLSDSEDARYVRSWFKEHADKCRFSSGWVHCLYMLSLRFSDASLLNLPEDLKQWRDLGVKAQKRRVNNINRLCGALADAIEAEEVFENLKVRDVYGLTNRWAAEIDQGVVLLSRENQLPDDVVNVMPLVEFINMVGEEISGIQDIERLNKGKNRGADIEIQMRGFAKACLRLVEGEFCISERPVQLITAMVNLKFSEASVVSGDVKNWLRD